MKRLTSMLIAIAMLLSLMPVTTFATSHALSLQVDTSSCVEVEAGETVAIPVVATTNEGITAFSLVAVYDENIFEQITETNVYTAGEAITTGFSPANNVAFYENASGEDLTATGTLFYINLKVKDNAPSGASEITVKILDDDAENNCYDSELSPVDFSCVPGTITIAAVEEEKVGYINGEQVLTFAEVKADNYTLTAPSEGSYYFAGWFTGLDAAGITANEDGYYVLSAGTASGTSYAITESRPKYDSSYDETAAYHALWVYDDATQIRSMLLGVVGSTVTFYSTSGDNNTIDGLAATMLQDALIAINTTGYVKMLHDMSITGLVLYNGNVYSAGHLDLNSNKLTTSEAIKVYQPGNIYESSHGRGEVISTASDSVFLTVNTKNSVLTLRDLKVTASTAGECCVEIKRDARLELMERCDLTSTDASAVYLYGRMANPASVGTINACTITSKGGSGINIYNASNQTIDMISNTTITSDTTQQIIKNVGTITFGANNTVIGENAGCMIDGGTVIFTKLDGTYKVASDGIFFDDDVTVTVPEGYVTTESNGVLSFIEGYQVTYMDHTGTKVLFVENVLTGAAPTGSYTVTYPNEQLIAYNHAGWAAEVGGTAITDFSAYTSATTFYAVRTASTLEAAVAVTDGTNTYQYASMDDAFAAFTAGIIADTAGTTVTFTLLADTEATIGITSKKASIVLDVNGHTLNYIGNRDTHHALIDDQGAETGRTITIKSSVVGGKIHGDLYAVALVQQNSMLMLHAADVRVENLTITTDMTGSGEAGDLGSDMNVIALGADACAAVDYTIVNSTVDTYMACINIGAVQSYSVIVTLENSDLRSRFATIVRSPGSIDLSIVVDANTKVKVNTDTNVLEGTVIVPDGYALADTDGDGWYMAECQHSWNDATCTLPKTCGNCRATEGAAKGHTYGEPTWTWREADEGGYTATAVFTCASNDDTRSVTATVTVTENIAATPSTDGGTVYTATAQFGDQTYTDIKTVVIPATGLIIGGSEVTDTSEPEATIPENSTSVEVKNADQLDNLDSLTVTSKENVVLKFLSDALDAIARNVTGNAEISVEPSTTTMTGAVVRYDFSVASGGTEVSFEGSVEVKVPFIPGEGKDGNIYRAWHMKDDGSKELLNTTITGDAQSGYFACFTMPHFSGVEIAPAAENGYIAGLNSTTTDVYVGNPVTVNVGVSSAGTDTQFNATEIVVTYPSNLLSPDTTSLTKSDTFKYTNVIDSNTNMGTLTIERIGELQNFSTNSFVLNFTAVTEGTATVTLTGAAFAHENIVDKDNLQAATLSPASIEINIDVETVNVTLPTQTGLVTGAEVTKKNADYTFTVNQKDYYNYVVKAIIGEGDAAQEIELTESTETAGQYTLDGQYVTDDFTISVTETAQTFGLTINKLDGSSETGTVTYNTVYTFTKPDPQSDKYTVSYKIMIGSAEYTSATVNEDGSITISGDAITDDVTITFTESQTEFDVTVGEGTGGNITGGTGENGEFKENDNATLEIEKKPGYTYTVTAKDAEGNPVDVIENDDGTYTVEGINSDITFTVVEELIGTVAVYNYLTLNAAERNANSSTMFLVTYTNEALSNYGDDTVTYAPYYGTETNPMLWSEKYQAYCWLVIVDNATLSVDDATAQVSIKTGTKATVNYGMDINGTGKIDAADAQFVYNMYKAMYNADFDAEGAVGMAKFLAADQNGDALTATGGAITVEDATLIIAAILAGTAQ